MSSHECAGCNEYMRLSRRQFMAATGAGGLAVAFPAWIPRVVYANDYCSNRDVIVSIFLRGASDGLTICVPYADPNYYAARPTLSIAPPDSSDPNKATALDDFFGLPPAMLPLLPAFQNGHLLMVHACGSTDSSRSHFDAQRFMEVGKPADSSLFTGWLGRHLYSVSPMAPNAVLRAVGIAYGLQRTLQGAPNALPIPDLDNFGLNGADATVPARRDALDDMYQLVGDPVKAAAVTTQTTIDLLNAINFSGYSPGGGALYPESALGKALKSTAALIRAEVGVEAVAIDLGGWDTHNNQGIITGTMATLMDTLADALAAFNLDMTSGSGKNVTTVCLSEFGRRVAQNGSGGSDHGHGNCMLVMGKDIDGGRVLRNPWPGLGPGQLYQNLDLEVTIDFRDVLAEIVAKRLGNTNLAYVFPDYVPTFQGVTGACQKGDMNCDGQVNASDVGPFVEALTSPAGYAASHPSCNIQGADLNSDGALSPEDADSLASALVNAP